jgi:hypothetical protein
LSLDPLKDILGRTRPTKSELVQDSKRLRQNPAIHGARLSGDAAQGLANAAQESADDAQSAADAAQTSANNAQTSANNAQTAADNAASAATAANNNANGRILNAAGSVSESNLAGFSVTSGKIGTSAVTETKVAEDAIAGPAIADSLNGPGQGTFGLRKITGSGGSQQAAAADHGHGSVNFKHDYAREERWRAIGKAEAVEALLEGARLPKWGRTLIELVLELEHQLMDDPDASAREWQERVERDPGARHEFLMMHDHEYHHAWMMQHDDAHRRAHPFLATREARDLFEERWRLADDPEAPLPPPPPPPLGPTVREQLREAARRERSARVARFCRALRETEE